MHFLTVRERRVLAFVVFLLAVGWAVQSWRLSQTPKTDLAATGLEDPSSGAQE